MTKYKEIDMSKIKASSIQNRKSKISAVQLAQCVDANSSFLTFYESLPSTLASRDLRELVGHVAQAVLKKKPVLWMMGAHVIKVGLSPVIIDLMKNGLIQGIAFNGAGAIHDVELAYFGVTSEDVAASLNDGSFGMVSETAELLNDTVRESQNEGLGFGEALGKRISEENPKYGRLSILGQAYQMNIPVTVHVALGTDIVHQHPSADGESIGALSLRDFRIWCGLVSQLNEGGVAMVIGSSVILPEVFLKALTVARNVQGPVQQFITANFDMIRHYRPRVNVVERPTLQAGKGYTFVGHHEIMIPLLAAAVKEVVLS